MNTHDGPNRFNRQGRRFHPVMVALILLTIGIAVSIPAAPMAAQGGSQTVTDDDVNAVAHKLYCPACEQYVPLDTCGTPACAQLRDEIRIQLEGGATPQQVIDSFVARFGDRVVGTPQDPMLRALALVTPWVISAVALLAAVIAFVRWQRFKTATADSAGTAAGEALVDGALPSTDKYRARLEDDLAQRR
jgi:cytochrome c-type biogenesis protein CcmH/NrfF